MFSSFSSAQYNVILLSQWSWVRYTQWMFLSILYFVFVSIVVLFIFVYYTIHIVRGLSELAELVVSNDDASRSKPGFSIYFSILVF